MRNNKTIIFGVVAIAFLSGVVWYAGNYGLDVAKQAASVLGSGEKQTDAVLGEEFFLGNPDAPVTIIEYSSHFCGHCANFHKDTLPLIMDEYIKTGKVKFISRLLSPLELGMAILCAQDQGKFAEFNEKLFEKAAELKAAEDIKIIAADLGLNQKEFNLCFDAEKYKTSVEKWFEQAQEDGVSGTPNFFVNGEQIVGNQPYSVFRDAIEKALAK
ncbi:DsbA family protein [Patescibacteria group bacterium]|nr:DsbA family protein [Patescibacteria group bacterium]